MHYLRISLIVESDTDLEEVREALTEDLENSLDGSCKVVNITHDRDLAKAFVSERSVLSHQVLTPPPPPEHPVDVTAVLRQYNFTLPKPKRGEPDWRVPKRELWGEISGLYTLRGKIVLTNGILAFLVREDGCWYHVHWNHFLADDLEALPDDLPKPQRAEKEGKKVEAFADFAL